MVNHIFFFFFVFFPAQCEAFGQKQRRQQYQEAIVSASSTSNSNHHATLCTHTQLSGIFISISSILHSISLSLSFLLGCRLLPLQCIRNLFNVPRKHSTVLHLSNFLFLRQIVNFRLVSNSVQHYCNHHINSIDIHTARSVHTHTLIGLNTIAFEYSSTIEPKKWNIK